MLSFLRLRGAAVAVLSGLVLSAACGGGDGAPGLTGLDGTGSGGARPGSPCDEGATQACSLTLGRHGNVLSCYHGTQTCENGVWQQCAGGALTEQAAPAHLPAPGVRQLALGDPVDCTDNPCDPFCETYSETPDVPFVPQKEDPKYTWEEGSLADFPGGLVKKGLQQPCQTGFDCQFNMRCEAPESGECTHGICETGEALAKNCNDCAALVIAADETCGPALPSGTSGCSHDPCVTGKGLSKTCNSCVKKICDTPGLSGCCTTSPNNNSNWTQACVDAVASVCGNTCGCGAGEQSFGTSCYYYDNTDKNWNTAKTDCANRGTGWNLVTINSEEENTFVSKLKNSSNSSVAKNIGFWRSTAGNANNNPCGGSVRWCWASDPGASLGYYHSNTPGNSTLPFYSWAHNEPGSNDTCAYMEGGEDEWKAITNNSCSSTNSNQKRDSVCEGPRGVMQVGVSEPHEWDSDCVELAEKVCDVKCNADDPTDTSGTCVPWYPGETDASCPGVDLAVGVPCDGKIPVCNHGNVTAKASSAEPILLMHFPANSQQFPTCSPSMTHPQRVTCQVTEDIPPGKCVTVDGDLCKLPNGNVSALSGNREIMVNPNGSKINTDEFGAIDECSCQDNWSLYSNSADTCGEPTCGGGNTAATQVKVPVDIIIVIDNSPSMDDDIEAVQERLNEDLAEVLAASNLDYRVIIVSRFGDESSAVSGSPASAANICIGPPLGANSCTKPANETLVLNPPFYHYSAEIESWDAWCQLLHGFNHPDEIGITDNSSSGVGVARPWTPRAPTGWQEWLRPEAFKHFLVITDDDADCDDYGYDFDDSTDGADCEPPSSMAEFFGGKQHDCHDVSQQTVSDANVAAGVSAAQKFDATLLALSPEHFGTASERNYMWHSIVNIRANSPSTSPWQPDDPIQIKMCTARNTEIVGAGTGYQALSRLTGGLRYPICQNSTFDAIFNAIAEEVIDTAKASCEFELGDTSNVDVDAATVSWTNKNDVSTSLTQVANAGACGTSKTRWYYDNPSNPTTLTLCPSTCAEVQADNSAQVWLEFGCPKSPTETTMSEVYEADCDPGETPQWAFLFYDTTVPSGSDAQVTFQVRAARSEADLENATFMEAAIATASAQDCAKNAPVAGQCPVDLYDVLGSLDAKERFLELQVTVTPGSDDRTPSVHDWELTYSCPPGE